MNEMHPFWQGVLHELEKHAIIDEAVQHPVAAAGVGVAGLAAGAGAVHVLRKTFNEGRPLGVPRPPLQKIVKGFGWKGMAGAGLAGGAAALYGAHKLKQRQQER